MNENIKELVRLASENPDLPIMAFVDGEICGDDMRRWCAEIGSCYIDEYIIDDYYGDGCVRFKSEEDDETIIEGIAEYKYNGTEEDYKKAEEELKTMWKKVIVLNIDLPSEL